MNVSLLRNTKMPTFSAEHENVSAHKYKLAFSYFLAEKFSCSAMFSKKDFLNCKQFKIYQQDIFHAQLS